MGVLVQKPSGKGYIKAQEIQKGRIESIPGVAEGSMAEHFLMSMESPDGDW
jgi:hypothetical protein